MVKRWRVLFFQPSPTSSPPASPFLPPHPTFQASNTLSSLPYSDWPPFSIYSTDTNDDTKFSIVPKPTGFRGKPLSFHSLDLHINSPLPQSTSTRLSQGDHHTRRLQAFKKGILSSNCNHPSLSFTSFLRSIFRVHISTSGKRYGVCKSSPRCVSLF